MPFCEIFTRFYMYFIYKYLWNKLWIKDGKNIEVTGGRIWYNFFYFFLRSFFDTYYTSYPLYTRCFIKLSSSVKVLFSSLSWRIFL